MKGFFGVPEGKRSPPHDPTTEFIAGAIAREKGEEGVVGEHASQRTDGSGGHKKETELFLPLLGIRRRIISRKGPYRPSGILPCLIIRVLHLEMKEEGVSLSFLLSFFFPLLLLLPALDNEALFRPLRSHRREKERRRRRTLRLTFSTLTTQKAAPPSSSAEREGGRPSLKACLPPPLLAFRRRRGRRRRRRRGRSSSSERGRRRRRRLRSRMCFCRPTDRRGRERPRTFLLRVGGGGGL